MALGKRIVLLVGILLFGVVIGSCTSGGSDRTTTADAPTVTVTKEAEVSVVPESCLNALDSADQGFELAGEALLIMGQAFEAISQADVATLEDALAAMDSVTAETEPVLTEYRAQAESCRSASEVH